MTPLSMNLIIMQGNICIDLFLSIFDLVIMFNFASLFNQFRSQSNSGLNDLLEQPGVQAGRLLEEESFVSEFKSGNPRIMEL